ncbi:hypothetical protein ACFQ1L_33170 [Phytohabitans flavus]|uniref:hypothetical protein n=1 Tax=Phytohabitans flavus TaxID=1076124 RepID=UPI00363F2631
MMLPSAGPVLLGLGAAFTASGAWWGVVLLVAGVPLTYLLVRRLTGYFRQRGRRVHQFTGGLVIIEPSGLPEAVAWDDVESFSHGAMQIHQESPFGTSSAHVGTWNFYALRCRDGRLFAISNEFKDTGPIAAALDHQVPPLQAARAEAKIAAGEEVDFGAIRVGPHDISVYRDATPPANVIVPPTSPLPDQRVPWTNIDRFEFSNNRLRIFARGDARAPMIILNPKTIWNFPALTLLLQRMRPPT